MAAKKAKSKRRQAPKQWQPGCCGNCGYQRNECAMDSECDFNDGNGDYYDFDE